MLASAEKRCCQVCKVEEHTAAASSASATTMAVALSATSSAFVGATSSAAIGALTAADHK
jgi:hypothetical protein